METKPKISRNILKNIMAAGKDSSRLNLKGNFGSKKNTIQKASLTTNVPALFVYPIVLKLPFNPMDLNDTSFNKENPYIIRGSVEENWKGLVQIASADYDTKKKEAEEKGETFYGSDIMEALCSAVGVDSLTAEHINAEGAELAALLKNIRGLDCPWYPTIQTFFEQDGEFGSTYGVRCAVDENGNIKYDESGNVIYEDELFELSSLCQALIAPQLDKFYKEYYKGGPKEKATKEEKTAAKKLITSKVGVSPVVTRSVARVLQFDADTNDDMVESIVSAINGGTDLVEYERLIGITKSFITENVVKYLGSSHDIHPSYLFFGVDACSETDKGKLGKFLSEKIAFRKGNTKKLEEMCTNFHNAYQKYRNNAEYNDLNRILKSWSKFKFSDPNVIRMYFENDMKRYQVELFDEEVIRTKFGQYLSTFTLPEDIAEALDFGDGDSGISEDALNEVTATNTAEEQVAADTADEVEEILAGEEDFGEINLAEEPKEEVKPQFGTGETAASESEIESPFPDVED